MICDTMNIIRCSMNRQQYDLVHYKKINSDLGHYYLVYYETRVCHSNIISFISLLLKLNSLQNRLDSFFSNILPEIKLSQKIIRIMCD